MQNDHWEYFKAIWGSSSPPPLNVDPDSKTDFSKAIFTDFFFILPYFNPKNYFYSQNFDFELELGRILESRRILRILAHQLPEKVVFLQKITQKQQF